MNLGKPTRPCAEIMPFSDSSEATCSVSSLSNSSYSGGESETLLVGFSKITLPHSIQDYMELSLMLQYKKETNNIIVVMFDEMNLSV